VSNQPSLLRLGFVWIRALRSVAPWRLPAALIRYARDSRAFSEGAESKPSLRDAYPCLADWTESTPFDAHYFFQSAWLARELARHPPASHVDVGSDVRMIAVTSGFVPTTFIDVRPLEAQLPNLDCRAGTLLSLPFADRSVASLSCLHVIEHVGLGRYGDPVDPHGWLRALGELQRVLADHGSLFVSVPVGRSRVCFNAHRVFDPAEIVDAVPELNLAGFSLVDDRGSWLERASLGQAGSLEYGCGLFRFVRPATAAESSTPSERSIA